MKALTYINTKTTIPNWVDTIHTDHPRGYAYETDTHFVHIYGRNRWFYIISTGLTAIQQKSGTLDNWVKATFGATSIQSLDIEVGHSIKGVWRPSLYVYDDIYQALGCSETEMRLAEQSIRVLIDKLDELFLYIEPDASCLDTYSHKTRELLILACTEVENSWKLHMKEASCPPIDRRNYTTKDYVKLVDKLHLREYQFRLRSYGSLSPFRPFEFWSAANPSTSLEWYDAYNKTKHDKSTYFSAAKIKHCIDAVVANLILHCVRFSPFSMFEQNNVFSSLVNQHFDAELVDASPTTFYLHNFIIPPGTRNDLIICDARRKDWVVPFKQLSLIL